MKYCIVTLGCPKNVVDSEGMGSILVGRGHRAVAEPEEADVVIVNTCGFLKSARDEALQTLRNLSKKKGPGQRLIATGCMIEVQGGVVRALSGVDGVLSTRHWPHIGAFLEELEAGNNGNSDGDAPGSDTSNGSDTSDTSDTPDGRIAAVPRRSQQASAYLKVSDGCDMRCAFCLIPTIKGPMRSKPRETVLAEATELVAQGVREIVLVAQHLTDYGRDRGEKEGLASLLNDLCATLPPTVWVRLMYAYPSSITPRLIATMARHPQICAYLDLPLQHAHPDTLRRMRRPADIAATKRTIADLREAIPDIVLRSTFIVGFPGETSTEFHTLLDFLEEMQFDHVGIFRYSREAGTPAATLPQVPPKTIKRRWHQAMQLQQHISLARSQRWQGRYLDVLVEGMGEVETERENGVETNVENTANPDPGLLFVGRAFRDAPEVDGQVFAWGEAEVGTVARVEITHTTTYDLWGKRVDG